MNKITELKQLEQTVDKVKHDTDDHKSWLKTRDDHKINQAREKWNNSHQQLISDDCGKLCKAVNKYKRSPFRDKNVVKQLNFDSNPDTDVRIVPNHNLESAVNRSFINKQISSRDAITLSQDAKYMPKSIKKQKYLTVATNKIGEILGYSKVNMTDLNMKTHNESRIINKGIHRISHQMNHQRSHESVGAKINDMFKQNRPSKRSILKHRRGRSIQW